MQAPTWDWAALLPQITVACGLAGLFIRWKVLRKRDPNAAITLDVMIAAFYRGTALPVGVLLLLCAFRPSLIQYLSNLNVALAAAGIASLYLAYKGLFAD